MLKVSDERRVFSLAGAAMIVVVTQTAAKMAIELGRISDAGRQILWQVRVPESFLKTKVIISPGA